MVDGQVDKSVAFIIQARMKSTRLPGKILLPIPMPEGKPLLKWIVDELKRSTLDHIIIVATSVNIENDCIENFCVENQIKCYRGDENDVLSRFLKILSKETTPTVVRLTADNPIIDIDILDDTIKYHILHGNDYTNTEGLPTGMNFEVIERKAFQDIENNLLSPQDREHVTLHIKNNSKYKKETYYPEIETFLSKLRLTVDYASDFTLANIVLANYSDSNRGLGLVKNIYAKYPWLFDSNDQNIQKKQYKTINDEINAAHEILNSFELKNVAGMLKNLENRVYIRVEGSQEIGFGHIVRCLALAHMLKNDFRIIFVSKKIPKHFEDDLKDNAFGLIKIKDEDDFLSIIDKKDFVVIDHYGFNTSYQLDVSNRCGKLICIDDLANRTFFADLIINHSPGVKIEMYDAQPYTQFALGDLYALIRPKFLKEARSNKISVENNSIMICFGGSDYKNLTLRTLHIVLQKFSFNKVTLVTGGAYDYVSTLLPYIAKHTNVEHFSNIDEDSMIQLMKKTSICIVPSSGILIEALAVGHKVVSGMYIENQKNIYTNYKDINAFFDAEDFCDKSLERAIKCALASNSETENIIDGNSGNRILKIFKQMRIEDEVYLRRALPTDLDLTFRWASTKKVRIFSFNQAEINFDEHSKWYMSKIKNSLYYIASWKSKPIGSIRFDIDNSTAKISYLIAPEVHEMGFGIILLKQGIRKVLDMRSLGVNKIIGQVIPENIASCKIFEKLNFIKELETSNYKYTLIINEL